jgi:hypothetical protein
MSSSGRLLDAATAEAAFLLLLLALGVALPVIISIALKFRGKRPESGHDRAARREEAWYGALVGYTKQGR